MGRGFQAAGRAKQKQGSDVLDLARISMERLLCAGLQKTFKDFRCINPFNLLNNCTHTTVLNTIGGILNPMLHMRKQRRKEARDLPKVTQSPTTVPLTPESLLTTTAGYCLMA